MKKILILLIVFISCYSGYAQTIVNRAGASNTVSDERHQAKRNAYLPRYTDTATANLPANIGIDSCGARIFTYSPLAVWYRGCSPKRWIRSLDVENFASFIDTAQKQAVTNITIIDDNSVRICTGDGSSCDTITISTTINNLTTAVFLTDSSIVVCDSAANCDTITIEAQDLFYFAQQGLSMINGNIIEWGGSLYKNATIDIGGNKVHFNATTVYDYPFQVYQQQHFSDGTGMQSWRNAGNTVAGQPDVNNVVKLGVNYTGANYPGLGTGYFGSKIGYLLNVNGVGNGSFGFRVDDQYAKFGGLLIHTFDTSNADAVTIFGARPPLGTYAYNMQPNTADSTRIGVFKNSKQVQFTGYGDGTRIAVPNTISGWDTDGNFVEVDTANMGGSITFIDSTKIIICSFGNYLCDTIFTTQGGLMSIYAANGLTKRNDSTIIWGGTLDQNTTLDQNYKSVLFDNANYFQVDAGSLSRGSTYYQDSLNVYATVVRTTETSEYILRPDSLVLHTLNASIDSRLSLYPGRIYVKDARLEMDKGGDIVAANDLTLGLDGNVFTVTGNTQINAIATANWNAGSVIHLIFTGTPTLKDNTAGGAGTAVMQLAGSTDFTAAAEDVITLVYDGTDWHETARKYATTGGTGVYTASNGLTMTSNNTKLGGTLIDATTTLTGGANKLAIDFNTLAGTNGLDITSTSTAAASSTQRLVNIALSGANATASQDTRALYASNTHTGTSSTNYAGYFVASGGTTNRGVYGESTTGIGVEGLATSASSTGVSGTSSGSGGTGVLATANASAAAIALSATSTLGIPGQFNKNPASTNTIENVLRIQRGSSGTPAAGIGGNIAWYNEVTSGATNQSAAIASTWTDLTASTEDGDLQFFTTLNGAITLMLRLTAEGVLKFTPMTATAASAITPAEGMLLFVSNTDATFTSVGLWSYQNGAWKAL
jgi:hypothetical protein